jgi:Domain of unknown function/Domain of unknown function (DUF4959)/Domain of unknown function (DUF5126)
MDTIYKICRVLIPVFTLLMIQFSCKKSDGYNDVISDDKTKPQPVSNVRVINRNGGAYITYSLPDSKNVLYVQAEYMINDTKSRQTKASFYTDTIAVSGFAKSQDYTVTLYTVNRADVKSDPVKVTVHPATPTYLLALPTVSIRSDFGGINISVTNAAKDNIGVITITEDATTHKMEIKNQNYTNLENISYSIRGYDTIPRKFGVYLADEFGNISDTVYATIKPIYETIMDKSKFNVFKLNSDDGSSFGWDLHYMWDGNLGRPGYHSTYPTTAPLPKWVTFDMGQTAKLSRFTLWGRGLDDGNYLWGYGNPDTWVMWGRADLPVDEILPDTMHLPALGAATPGGWINMGVFHLPAQPSGLVSPAYNNADLAFWNAGFGYNFSLNLPKVRYMRFECVTNAAHSNEFFHIMELSIWGDNR